MGLGVLPHTAAAATVAAQVLDSAEEGLVVDTHGLAGIVGGTRFLQSAQNLASDPNGNLVARAVDPYFAVRDHIHGHVHVV